MLKGQPIPGMYYDAEKGKYFAIQPNHRAPSGAKHSVQNVRQEEQVAKRRKVEMRWQRKVERETIKRSPMLNFQHAGLSLARELGLQSYQQALVARSRMFASQCAPEEVLNLGSCHDCGAQQLVQDYAHAHSRAGPYMVTGRSDGQSSTLTLHEDLDGEVPKSTILTPGIRTRISTVNIVSEEVMVTTAEGTRHINFWITRLLDDVKIQAQLGPRNFSIQDCSLELGRPCTTAMMLANDENFQGCLSFVDLTRGESIGRHRDTLAAELTSCDWLDRNVAIFGNTQGVVGLYDLRANGGGRRFTGRTATLSVRSHGDGHGIWTASQDRISLYDVRMGKYDYGSDTPRYRAPKSNRQATASAFNIPFQSKRPKVEMAVWHQADLLVYSLPYVSNTIHLHSLADGSHVRSLPPISPGGLDTQSDNVHWTKKFKEGFDSDDKSASVMYYAHGTAVEALYYGKEHDIYDTEAWGPAEKAIHGKQQIRIGVKKMPTNTRVAREGD
ncbi:Hypothetical protein D9617_5g070920 [Elsinoe fawcettii]|nr:Hypothetical protein D9617_5g070920 [Elsinoe fawcettii]